MRMRGFKMKSCSGFGVRGSELTLSGCIQINLAPNKTYSDLRVLCASVVKSVPGLEFGVWSLEFEVWSSGFTVLRSEVKFPHRSRSETSDFSCFSSFTEALIFSRL